MAYQQDYSEDENNQNGQGTTIGPSSTSNPGAPGSAAGASGAPNQQPAAKGSGFTNLDQYVGANQDQSKQMATGLTSGIQGQINQNNTDAQAFGNQISQTAKNNTVTDNGVISGLQNNASQFSDKNWIDQYNKQTAGYQGPKDVYSSQPYQDLSTRFSNADQQVKGLSTPGGLQSTLKDTYGKSNPGYTQGQNLLDTFLTQSGPGGQTLSDFQNSYNGNNALTGWNNQVNDLNSQLGQAQQTSQATQQATQNAYGSALGGYQDLFAKEQQQAGKQSADAGKAAEQERGNLSGYSQPSLTDIGVSAPESAWLKQNNYNLGSLVQNPSAQYGLGDIATQGQQSGYQALLGLSPGMQSQYNFSPSNQGSQAYSIDQNALNSIHNSYNQYLDSLKPASSIQSVATPSVPTPGPQQASGFGSVTQLPGFSGQLGQAPVAMPDQQAPMTSVKSALGPFNPFTGLTSDALKKNNTLLTR